MAILITLAIVALYAVWALRRGRASGAGPQSRGWPKPGQSKKCVWATTGKSKGRFVEYRCNACGFEALSHTGTAPKDCKAAFEKGL